ncbi:MAG: hypothetical protein E6G53_14920 [Actinobacteria bacterium]|nr:MAG: hypothetical protein E6G53_14920 [Actinomycetota bacterium]
MRRLALILATLGASVAGAPAAQAAAPIMPLSDVHAGMHCTALSVIHGTTISSFDADVIDVVDGLGLDGPAILVRVSGPAVDGTGIGPGFSGSPIYCDDSHGVSRNIGAIAFGLGDYGNKLSLATPIQAVIGEPVTPPARMRTLSRRESASIRRLATPLTVSGLTPLLAQRLTAAARAQGVPVYASPAGPLGSFPRQQLRPGASVAAGLASGNLGFSAIGTVTYTDGNAVWAFGHPLDAAGRRALLMQDAYVYTVVNNPNGDLGTTYKLAAAGHDLGTVTGDSLNAITGLVGALPPITELTIRAADLDTGKVEHTRAKVPDEIALGPPSGISPLGIVASTALADAGVRVLQSDPLRETATMCVRVAVDGHARVLRFCNRYVGDGSFFGNGGLLAASDLDSATALLDSVQFPGFRVRSLSASLDLRRGLAQTFMTGASARRKVAAGHRLGVTVRTLMRGERRRFTFKLNVPRHLRPGRYRLTLTGPGPDGTGGGGGGLAALLAALLGGPEGAGGGPPGPSELGPASFADLASQFARMGKYDGLAATFTRARRRHPPHRRLPALVERAYRNSALRIGGRVTIRLRVTRP